MALFGKKYKEENELLRAKVAELSALEQLIILINLESYNAEMIKDGISQSERLERLNQAAITQAQSLADNPSLKRLGNQKLLNK